MSIQIPLGFRLGGVHCGLKRNTTRQDLSLVVSYHPAVAAGVYTQNLVFAAPVALDRSRTPGSGFRAVVINSGNANACTGERGLADAREMARLAAAACDATGEQALVMSTGIIGEYLPMEKIAAGIAIVADQLGTGEESLVAAARGMMTTDTVHKLAGRTLSLGGRTIRITGMAKGAAMIGPRMGTMLGLILSDAPLTAAAAQQSLSAVVDDTFNCISVEGHMSTNDTVLLVANGAAGGSPLAGSDLAAFQEELHAVAAELARSIPADGEGATHLVLIEVSGCATREAARQIAKTVADSALVKTAIAGADPNWGRIVSAAGYAGVAFDPLEVELNLNGFLLYRGGAPTPFDAAAVSASIRAERDTIITLRFSEGDARVRFWTTDLTAEYIRLNADYHT
ncbi:MAG TPA: bifunctional glutamate N-acetyltransferase/amino-acid acetyltransferase ArgJ [Pirellulales bacterium]|jgi:glutamate N-acetyltransferase/amino-acid N-acetyltransferase|nr:bifunctional glutamate N-acetyltransferase/amino-acid acetyltransferase ArgJ [Pirellulales bacterium]